jgi:hypothetical protein
MCIAIGLLCALVALILVGLLAPSQKPADVASQPAKRAPTTTTPIDLARIKTLADQLMELKSWMETERAAAVYVMVGAAAQQAKIGLIDYDELMRVVGEYLVKKLPASVSDRFNQLIRDRRPLQVIAIKAEEQGVFEDATKIIRDIFGPDQAAWSPAARDLFRDWRRIEEEGAA